MVENKKKDSGDVNITAFNIVDQATNPIPKPQKEKNPAAVALGRLGGLKGGKARAAKLSTKKRKEIAQLAATARWKRQKG